MDGYLLLRGNAGGSHGGLSPLVSSRPEEFYQKQWGDLYRACQFLRRLEGAGPVRVEGCSDKYVYAFSGRLPVGEDQGDTGAEWRYRITGQEAGQEPRGARTESFNSIVVHWRPALDAAGRRSF